MSIQVRFPDGSSESFAESVSISNLAEKRARDAVAVRVNGELSDLSAPVEEGAVVEFITVESPEGLDIMRHSAAHVLAAAVQKLYPGTRFGFGPSEDNGFYYDFDIPDNSVSVDDLPTIGAEVRKIIKRDVPFVREEMSRNDAVRMLRDAGEILKAEHLERLEDQTVSFYRCGNFVDMCRGPHVPSTKRIGAVKMTAVAGAYWLGDAAREQLTRIRGVAFPTKKELKKYLENLEEAKRRDHRKIGRELDLYSFHEEAPGMVFWHHKGWLLFNVVRDYIRRLVQRYEYQEINTPVIMNKSLWLRSGHWEKFRDKMYFTEIDKGVHAIKPMNCPGGMLVFKTRRYSYRDLPLRVGEIGLVHRHEQSGELHGLLRVRQITQDDAHSFITEEQATGEICALIDQVVEVYRDFGLNEWRVELSTKPEQRIGSDEAWEQAENSLREALETKGLEYKLNPGEGAFYGPKIDFHVNDCLGRTWQGATIQLDFAMPERFDLTYQAADNSRRRPVMIHRAILGSFERFIGLLIEQYAGDFPLWLAPVQVRVASITERNVGAVRDAVSRLKASGVRIEEDVSDQKLGRKVREWRLAKVPLLLVIGDKEVETGTVDVRSRADGRVGTMTVEQIGERFADEFTGPLKG